MRSFLRILALLALPLTTLSDTVVPAGTPQEIVPFSTLPQCAQKCGKLFDVQGACTPPVTTTIDNACFCADSRLSPFLQSSTLGVCNDACPDDPSGLLTIMKWVNSFCAGVNKANPTTTSSTTTGTATATATGTAVPGSAGSGGTATPKKQTWMDTHWQWIVMVVILFIAFVGGWIAACFFHRRYLRKNELNYEMRPPAAPWVTGHSGPYGGGFGDAMGGGKEAMMTSALPSAKVTKDKKKWIVREST